MADNADPGRYQLLAHASQCCFARVLRSIDDDGEGRRSYRCSNCGTAVTGRSSACICCCGKKTRSGTLLGLVCVVNTARSPDCPSEVVVTGR